MRWRAVIATLTVAGTVALAACANPAQVQIDRARELVAAGRTDEAIEAFTAALELDPDNVAALAGRGCARSLSDSAGAMADLDRAIELDPKESEGFRCRAEAYRYMREFEAALSDARKATELGPSDPFTHITLGNVLDDLGRTADAIPEYDEAISELSDQDDQQALANAYNQRHVARKRLGDDAGARADLDKAIELDPEYGPAYANRAMDAVFEGDCDQAIADATKAIKLEPDYPTAYGARALCLADAGDLDGALDDAERAIELGRNDMFAYYTRALIHAERGDDAEATADFQTAIGLASSAAEADGIRALMAEYGLRAP